MKDITFVRKDIIMYPDGRGYRIGKGTEDGAEWITLTAPELQAVLNRIVGIVGLPPIETKELALNVGKKKKADKKPRRVKRVPVEDIMAMILEDIEHTGEISPKDFHEGRPGLVESTAARAFSRLRAEGKVVRKRMGTRVYYFAPEA